MGGQQMTLEEAVFIVFDEIREAMNRASARIDASWCDAPPAAVIATAISLFLDKSPETRAVLLGVMNKRSESQHADPHKDL